jgi:hypothetical protein
LLNRTATGDEIMGASLTARIKACFNAMETSQLDFSKKFKVTPSAGKFMLIVFGDSQGVLLVHFQKCEFCIIL